MEKLSAIIKEKKKGPRNARNICFTLNNYTCEEEAMLKSLTTPITYICFGYEVGENGTKHLQGYAEAYYSVPFGTWKGYSGLARAHIEPRKGSQEEAINYCQKDGTFFEAGIKKANRQGKRFDLDEVREIAGEAGMRDVVPWANAQQIRVAEKYLQYAEPPRTWKPVVTWLYGKTGCGKTRMAHAMYPDAYVKSDSSKWWDGYDAHEDVLLDDFRCNWMTFNDLLTLIDRYERKVEIKGGMRQFKPKNIIITSSKHPRDCYNDKDDRVDQLLRRIDIIECLDVISPSPEVTGNTIAVTSPYDEGIIVEPKELTINETKSRDDSVKRPPLRSALPPPAYAAAGLALLPPGDPLQPAMDLRLVGNQPVIELGIVSDLYSDIHIDGNCVCILEK